jgi:DNA invertase Pin-like site-specific DNA recombinase
LKALRAGDVLVVWRLDRLGRNLPDLVRIVGELEGSKVGLESITEQIESVMAGISIDVSGKKTVETRNSSRGRRI